jgi:hypothetical protein
LPWRISKSGTENDDQKSENNLGLLLHLKNSSLTKTVRAYLTCIIHELHHKDTKSTKTIELKAFPQLKLSLESGGS